MSAIGVAVYAIDLATKTWAARVLADDPVALLPWLRLTEVRNPGAAFGLADGATVVLTGLALAAVLLVLVVTNRARRTVVLVVLGLVLGGALGNVSDRVFRSPGLGRGWVVDWISVGWWPVFNLADVSVVTAACLTAASAAVRTTRSSSGTGHARDGAAG